MPRKKVDLENETVERESARIIAIGLKNLRESVKFTQSKLASKLGTKQASVSRLERKKITRIPGLATIVRIAQACGYAVHITFVPLTDSEAPLSIVVEK